MNALIASHFLNPRRWCAPVQTLSFTDLHTGHGFQNAQDKRLLYFTALDLPVAMILVLQHQIVGANRNPKALIIHGGEPLLNLIQIFESAR